MINQMSRECCGVCRYAVLEGQFCRRFPPRVITHSNGKVECRSPNVVPSNWCGEFELAQEPTR